MQRATFELAIPVLHVSDSRRAENFYRSLGFELEFEYRIDPERDDPCYFGMRRDRITLHLSSFSGDGVAGGIVFIVVSDVDVLHRELMAQGIAIALEPTDQTWGNREMYVGDPDGNSLRFVVEGP